MAFPPGVVTLIAPVTAALAVKVIDVDETTVKLVIVVVPTFTDVAPDSPVPVIVIVLPTFSVPVIVLITGTGVIAIDAVVAVPPGVVITTTPVTAPAGTVNEIAVGVLTNELIVFPARVTLLAAPRNDPVIATVPPMMAAEVE